MSSHNSYEPNWNYYRQGQRVSRQQGGSLGQASIRAQGSNLGTQAHGGMSHPSPSQDSGSHGQGSILQAIHIRHIRHIRQVHIMVIHQICSICSKC
ncbi:hypothetical protein ASG99_23815 [Bacillus sp. Soil768D1]|nr:hypothetical protein ASG99_23815 [Bacillus sp. Soil768D1]